MKAENLTDLISRAQRREPEAFDALVETYSSRLYGYFYRRTGSRHDAEDLLQEVFVRLVRMVDQYEHDGRFDAWLFRIAANLIRDRLRRARRMSDLHVPAGNSADGAGLLHEVPDTSARPPDFDLNRSEQIDRLQQAIEQLPDPEREVICLRHFSQMSFKEVAEVMDTPLGTALARAHRGLARLRELMEDET